jgi:hypothetical protein
MERPEEWRNQRQEHMVRAIANVTQTHIAKNRLMKSRKVCRDRTTISSRHAPVNEWFHIVAIFDAQALP